MCCIINKERKIIILKCVEVVIMTEARFNEIVKNLDNIVNENEPKFRKIFNNSKNAYAILQLPIEADYKFRGFEDVVKMTKKIPTRADYKLIYAKALHTKYTEDGTPRSIADDIFTIFNLPDRPGFDEDYYGTSVSVSDVLVIKINDVVFIYYVDTFGFQRLENFEV